MTARVIQPFKVVPYEPGAANVLDRKTGERLGYVVQWAHGWAAYLDSNPGDPLIVRVVEVTDERMRPVIGPTIKLTTTPHRADAAKLVWKATHSQHGGAA